MIQKLLSTLLLFFIATLLQVMNSSDTLYDCSQLTEDKVGESNLNPDEWMADNSQYFNEEWFNQQELMILFESHLFVGDQRSKAPQNFALEVIAQPPNMA